MNRELSTLPGAQTPTRVRYGVLGFACSLSAITYLDRVCFGTAASSIVHDLGLGSVADLKWAFTAFTISYAAFEIPTGWLGDVYGPRKTIIRIVLWWSLFTILTGFVGLSISGYSLGGMYPLLAMVVVRFLFGMGEAGAYPNLTRALHNWFPFVERGFAQGAVWMSGRLMGGLTPFIWVVLLERLTFSWREAFWLFGVIGMFWCIAFWWWFSNRPDEKPEVNNAERELINAGRHDTEAGHARVPWLYILKSTNLWALCLMYFCGAYGWYFNITYLPDFLETQFDVKRDSDLGAIYKGGPLLFGAVTCLLGGILSDRFIRRTGNRKWGRRLFGIIGHGMCGLCYLACLFTPTAFWFFLAISMAAFWNDLTMGSAWATCQDIGKRYAAIIAGCMNTIGNLGGAAASWVTGTILHAKLSAYAVAQGAESAEQQKEFLGKLSASTKASLLLPGYQINFMIFACVYFLAVLLWFRINSTEPVVPEEAM